MDKSIYNKMKNIIKNDINYLKSFQIGSGKIEDIIESLLRNKSDYDTMNENIETYIDRLKELDKLIKDDTTDSTKVGLLSTVEKLEPLSTTNIFDESSRLGKFKKDYTEFVKDKLWNKDRLSLDAEATDQTDPTKYDIFFNVDENPFETQLKDFNEKLKIIYDPYIVDSEKSLKDNIIANIDKIDEIIDISKKFNDYIKEKKIKLDEILLISFDSSELIILDKIPENETEKISFESIQLKKESALNMSALNEIESHINTISESIEIDDKITSLKDINIFSAKLTDETPLEKLLDVDDAIDIVQKQIGGNDDGVVDDKYYTFESNLPITDLVKKIEYLFELLDNIFNNFEYMKELQYRYNFYIHYLFLVISESTKNPKMETYQYISKNTAQLYQKIFQNIKKSFTTIKEDDKEIIFLNKYHYLTVFKLSNLIDFILSKLQNDQVVDVNACKGNIHSDLILLNHFRQIIITISKTNNGQKNLGLNDEEKNIL
jgi:hypothetical protein